MSVEWITGEYRAASITVQHDGTLGVALYVGREGERLYHDSRTFRTRAGAQRWATAHVEAGR